MRCILTLTLGAALALIAAYLWRPAIVWALSRGDT
jgi:hypothetical protein